MAGYLRKTAERIGGWKLSLASAFAWLISSLTLIATGLHHMFSPAEAMLADLLGMVNLTVAASPELSLAGVLWLLSILVGLIILVTGLQLLYCFGRMVLDLFD